MIRVAFAVYRQWGYDIFKEILEFQKEHQSFALPLLILPTDYECRIDKKIKESIEIVIIDPNNTQSIHHVLKDQNIDIIFWYSWSWIVRQKIIDDFINLCLHPSPLPKYRGGTPIQHQIINGEKNSAITIFKMQNGIDDGPIYKQTPISFDGDLNDIFRRMVTEGVHLTKDLIADSISDKLMFHPQKDLAKYPPNKRRTPAQSEIKNAEKMTFEELHNLVRGLIDPYPNTWIKLQNGTLFIQEVLYCKELPSKKKLTDIFLKLKNGYAKVTKSRFEKIK